MTNTPILLSSFQLIQDHVSTISNDLINLKSSLFNLVEPVGSGSIFLLPSVLLDNNSRLLIIVPTDNAIQLALGMYKVLMPGIKYGYAVDLDQVNYNETDQVVIATSLYLRDSLLTSTCQQLTFDYVFIVDFDHSLNNYIHNCLSLALWSHCDSDSSKLIISSRTPLNDLPEIQKLKLLIQTYILPSQNHPVEINYLDRFFGPEESLALLQQTAKTVYTLVGQAKTNLLILAPDDMVVQTLADTLPTLWPDGLPENLNILPVYTTKVDERTTFNLIEQTENNQNNINVIILSDLSNLALVISGVINQIDILVDMMYQSEQTFTISGGVRQSIKGISSLKTAQIRASLVGRTRAGLCIRMTQPAYFKRLVQLNLTHRSYDLMQAPLYRLLLPIYLTGKSSLEDVYTLWPQFKRKLIRQVWANLTRWDLDKDRDIVTQLPLSVRNNLVLAKWLQQGYPLFPAIVALTFIDSGPNYYKWPLKPAEVSAYGYEVILAEHRKTYFAPLQGYSDVATYLNIWTQLILDFGGYDSITNLTSWCSMDKGWSLQLSKIQEVLAIIQQSMDRLAQMDIEVTVGPFDSTNTLNLLRPILTEVYSDLIFQYQTTNLIKVQYVNPDNLDVYNLGTVQNVNGLGGDPPNQVVALITSQLDSIYGKFKLINMALDLR